MAVDLAPGAFCPAGVGNRQVQAVILNALPVFCRDNVSERIAVIVRYHLRLTGRAGGKIHQHQVGALVFDAGKALRLILHQLVDACKALPVLPHGVQHRMGSGLCRSLADAVTQGNLLRTDHGTDIGRHNAVFDVMHL